MSVIHFCSHRLSQSLPGGTPRTLRAPSTCPPATLHLPGRQAAVGGEAGRAGRQLRAGPQGVDEPPAVPGPHGGRGRHAVPDHTEGAGRGRCAGPVRKCRPVGGGALYRSGTEGAGRRRYTHCTWPHRRRGCGVSWLVTWTRASLWLVVAQRAKLRAPDHAKGAGRGHGGFRLNGGGGHVCRVPLCEGWGTGCRVCIPRHCLSVLGGAVTWVLTWVGALECAHCMHAFVPGGGGMW